MDTVVGHLEDQQVQKVLKDTQAIDLRFASQKTSDVGSSLPMIPSKGREFASKESEDLI